MGPIDCTTRHFGPATRPFVVSIQEICWRRNRAFLRKKRTKNMWVEESCANINCPPQAVRGNFMSEILFEQFRLNLRSRVQRTLFGKYDDLSRDEWIRLLFSVDVEFMHYGSLYHYVPKPVDADAKVLVGRLGRKTYATKNTPPESGLEEYIDETWRACVIVIDPTEHKDGQKVAMQRLPEVGSPVALLPQLIQALEGSFASDGAPFSTSINPISSSQEFTNFVKKNQGKVTRVSFYLDVPNMYNSEDEYDREMKAFRDKEHAQKVKIEISNPDGIDADSERVRFTAEKAMERGTGKVTAKAMGKNNTFSSQKTQKKVKIQLDDDEAGSPLIDQAEANANRIFGRDED